MNVPALETERLTLRGPQLSDFPAYAAMWADPRMAPLGTADSHEQSWINFHFNAGQWALMRIGCWAVVEKAGKRFIGIAGFHYTNRTMEYAGRDGPEISWGIARDFHRKGLGHEAVRAVLAWADEQLPDSHTWCLIELENLPSIALARGQGYEEVQRTEYRGKPMIVFARSRKSA